MTDIELSKLDAERRQLEVAIRLYFSFGDEVSIHTLAAASKNLLFDICKHRKVTPPMSLEILVRDLVKPEYRQEIKRKVREPENFFKHADRDPNERLIFNSDATEFGCSKL